MNIRRNSAVIVYGQELFIVGTSALPLHVGSFTVGCLLKLRTKNCGGYESFPAVEYLFLQPILHELTGFPLTYPAH
ncbi:hypothetical protein ANCDUO_00533 [Ancylostoma duodenale]|uniref:Uncharacterized protein n=1 Tax=Ancylostoma duodenale TaxID=51022 RepID=A0A0C2HHK3_9BILA|nr:hypothetical protein ANCDUO_00533 [Ancylostoma duodenale]